MTQKTVAELLPREKMEKLSRLHDNMCNVADGMIVEVKIYGADYLLIGALSNGQELLGKSKFTRIRKALFGEIT